MNRASKPGAQSREQGFTLIELLIVIIIIGILAAIAIPIFLKQRSAAVDAAAKSDLRNLAQFEESYLVDTDLYGPISSLKAAGNDVRASRQVSLTVVRYNGAIGYCLSAKSAASTTTWYWDSQSGGLLAKGSAGCPLTTTGTAGDSITG